MAALEPQPEPRSPEEDAIHLPRERGGRKSLLTEDVHDALVNALNSGATVRDSCLYANVGQSIYYYWMQRGRKYDEHLDDEGDIIDGEDVYRRFWIDASQARAAASVRMTSVLAKGAMEAPWATRARIAMWYLERTDPEEWGRVNRLELTGRGGGPVAVQVTEVESRLAGDIRAMRERVEAEAAEAAEIEEAEVIEPEPPPELQIRSVNLDL